MPILVIPFTIGIANKLVNYFEHTNTSEISLKYISSK